MNTLINDSCPFCDREDGRVVFQTQYSLAIWDGYPVTEGHILVVPKRHTPVWHNLRREELADIGGAIAQAQRFLRDRYAIDGFNVGFNEGAAAGQTVPHFHVHVIPRRIGDMADPRGGVRHVIPEKGNYVRRRGRDVQQADKTPHSRALIAGGEDALLPHLIPHIQQANAIDVAVAFVLDSGVRILHPHLQEFLDRQGRLRIVAGDYLDVSDPTALRRMLDLDGNVQRWMFEANLLSFHPKSWIFHYDHSGVAIVGSSNISETALQSGIEWNYRVFDEAKSNGWADVLSGFEALIERREIAALTNDWIDRYEERRVPVPTRRGFAEVAADAPVAVPVPHPIQQRALDALKATRRQGYTAGLVVLATGLGKTWLSAFDSELFERVLFVAHREEILTQAMATFRCIRPNSRLGRYNGVDKDVDADVLFASIQTLGRSAHLRHFAPDAFDYVVVDEFHHAAAPTYKKLIGHFTPRFLLGLTATPERTDGGDLLALCQENIVFRCDVFEGIEAELLAPFRYFGVPDEVDYEQIPWRSSAFDEEKLTQALATQARAQNAFEQMQEHGGSRAIGFCCSRLHADFMAAFFAERGLRAASVHSGDKSAPRVRSLERLQAGELDVVFAVDMFNEGVDVPEIDTVLMLRPTESAIVWMQQFGRGLRRSTEKSHLVVVDYIGNHRIFLSKVRSMLGATDGDRALALKLEAVRRKEIEFPPGCEVTYELKALEILEGLLRSTKDADALEAFYADFKLRHGIRPTATEVFHAGFDPESTGHRGWFSFVRHMEDLDEFQKSVEQRHGAFLQSVSVTPMSKSYKMLVLDALLAEEDFMKGMNVDSLAQSVIKSASRNPRFASDLSVPLDDVDGVRKLLVEHPIAAWVEGKGTGGERYFEFKEPVFRLGFDVHPAVQATFKQMTGEIVDWRIAQYLARSTAPSKPVAVSPKNLDLWQSYTRSDIPPMFGAVFNTGSWNSGMVLTGQNLVLLVTLTKGNLAAGNEYLDHFIDDQVFEWQSQNQTTQASKHGRIINGSMPGHSVHLFIRPTKLRGGGAAPFIYCGVPQFVDWRGEKPITVQWKLETPVPEHLRRLFKVDG